MIALEKRNIVKQERGVPMFKCKAGFAGFGEINTPRELVEELCEEAKKTLEGIGFDLVSTPPISDDEQGVQVKRAVQDLKKEDFDFLVVCITGWIPSHAVISVISEFKEKPMILWGLTGKEVDGRLVTTAAQAGTTALRKPMCDMGYRFEYIYEVPGGKPKTKEIEDFARAACAVERLKRSKIGQMGYRDMRLYGTMFDGVSLRGKIGVEVEFFEMLEIYQRMQTQNSDEINRLVDKVKREWRFEKEADPEAMETGVKVYLAIRDKILECGYDAVSLIDVDGMKKLMKFPPSMVFMLLANELGICTVPENDTLGAVTQLFCKYATGQISAYMEFYEFMEDRVLIGVPDYIPAEVTEGPVRVDPTSFGQLSQGILNVSGVKTGRATMCRLGSTGDKYMMQIVTGEAAAPRKWEEAGWQPPAPQLPSLEFIMDTPVEDFAQKVMSQHCIITYQDNSRILKNMCRLLDIDII
jgi:L-fucose isomerase-like protein